MYTEMEWIKSDSTPDQDKGGSASPEDDAKANGQRRGAEDGITLNGREWQETVQKLVATFNKPDAAKASAFGVRRHVAAFESADMSAHSKKAAPDSTNFTGRKLSPLREDGALLRRAVMNKGKDRLKLATVAWLKEPLRSWLAKAETQVPVTMAAVSANYTLPVISGQSDNSISSVACTDDTWTAPPACPLPLLSHGSVDRQRNDRLGRNPTTAPAFLTPAGDTIPAPTVGQPPAPPARPMAATITRQCGPAAEMIVWGGYNGASALNTGGRYNPSTDSWTATSTTNAPAGRSEHTAVWTGSEMIVWGGIRQRRQLFEHRRAIQSRHRQLDSHQPHQRAARARRSHGSVDRQRNDRLGWS